MSEILIHIDKNGKNEPAFQTANELFSVCLSGDIDNPESLVKLCAEQAYDKNNEELLLTCLSAMNEKNKTELLFNISDTVFGSASFAFIPSGEKAVYCRGGIAKLFIGISQNAVYLAENLSTLLPLCEKYAIVDYNETAKLSKDRIAFYNSKHKRIKKAFTNFSEKRIDNGSFIIENEEFCCPAAARETCIRFVKNGELSFDYMKLRGSYLNKINKIILVGSASSKNTALACKSLFESYCLISTQAFDSEELIVSKTPIDKNTLVITISDGGSDIITLEAVIKAKECGAKTIALTSNKYSALALESDGIISPKKNSNTIGTTSKFVSDYLALSLFSLYIGFNTDVISELFLGVSLKMAEMLSGIIQAASKNSASLDKSADLLGTNNVYVTASGEDYPLCFKAAEIIRKTVSKNAFALPLSELSELESPAVILALICSEERLKSKFEALRNVSSEVVIITGQSTAQKIEGFENIITFNDSLPIFNPLPCIAAVNKLSLLASEKLHNIDAEKSA